MKGYNIKSYKITRKVMLRNFIITGNCNSVSCLKNNTFYNQDCHCPFSRRDFKWNRHYCIILNKDTQNHKYPIERLGEKWDNEKKDHYINKLREYVILLYKLHYNDMGELFEELL